MTFVLPLVEEVSSSNMREVSLAVQPPTLFAKLLPEEDEDTPSLSGRLDPEPMVEVSGAYYKQYDPTNPHYAFAPSFRDDSEKDSTKNYNLKFQLSQERPHSSVAEHLIRNEEVGSSKLPVGCSFEGFINLFISHLLFLMNTTRFHATKKQSIHILIDHSKS